jgi:hypothetical protein
MTEKDSGYERHVDENMRKFGRAPVIVVHKNQARLIFSNNYFRYEFASAIAKPWKTEFRGEVFLYVPKRTKNVSIDFDSEALDIPEVNWGLVGVAVLDKIEKVENQAEWKEKFSRHREIGPMPFLDTYLWYLPLIVKYRSSIEVDIGGKWWDEEFEKDHRFEQEALGNLEKNILPNDKKELHWVNLYNLIYGR